MMRIAFWLLLLCAPAFAGTPQVDGVQFLGLSNGSVTAKANATGSAWSWWWPTTAGTAGQCLSSNGGISPNLWINCGTIASVIAGTGLTGGGSSGTITLSLANIPNNTLLGNTTGVAGPPVPLSTLPAGLTLPNLTVTGGFTATGLVTNGDLASPSITVNGVTCTLGSVCTPPGVGGITGLTGDVTATGPGSAVATLVTVNGNVGSFGDGTHVGAFTVNSKGLITAASSVAITGGGGGGVSSVALAMPGIFTISGSPVTASGTLTATAAGTSGGVPYFSSSTALSSSAALAANQIVLGGGAGVAPATLGSLGTTTTLLHGNATGAPTYAAVNLGTEVTGSLAYASLATESANTVLGALSATTPSGLSVPSCSTASSALTWTSGSGFGCNSITGGSGTVTSVGLATPNSTLTLGGTNPVTTSGTINADINLSHANTWAAAQSFGAGDLKLNGATSGATTLNAAAIAGTTTITLPGGTTDFSATGGTSQVVKQTSSGGAFTVAQLACADLSNGATGCSTATGTSGATIPLLNGTNTWSAQQSGSITTLAISTATFTPDGTNNNYKITLVHASCPCTLANPSATPVAGTAGQIMVIQSATGSDTIGTWGSQYESPGGTSTITLSTGASAVDVLSYYVQDSTHILLFPSLNFSH